MTNATQANATLSTSVKKWRAALRDADVGPLIIAGEVVHFVDHWDEYRHEVGNLTASAFLRRELGRGRDAAFFRRRADAVAKLGEDIRRWMHHEVAVWIAANFDGQEAEGAVFVVRKETKTKHHGNPLNYAQAKPIVEKALNRKTERAAQTCPRCVILEEQNRAMCEQLEAMGVHVEED